MMTIYDATPAERSLATDWHGGQSSMLYAVASTGALARGTIGPRWWDGSMMSEQEWDSHLVSKLQAELGEVQKMGNDDERAIASAWVLKLTPFVSD